MKILKKHYALFGTKGIDADTFGNGLRSKVTSNTTDKELFDIIGAQAKTVKDGHVTIKSPFATSEYNFYEKAPENNFINPRRYLIFGAPGAIQSRNMLVSTLGYIAIPSFEGTKSEFEAIDEALNKFSDKKGIIIDVRSNGGGQTENAEIVASRFATQKFVYGKASIKLGANKNDFSAWEDMTITPKGTKYEKPIVVLTNRKSFSSTEIFVMIMQNFPNVQIVGDTTGGGIGAPAARELPNGWVYRLSTHRIIRPDGSTPEGKGIFPTFPLWTTPADIANGNDKLLDKAIDLLK